MTCFCTGITLQSVQAQLTGISIEPIITHDGSIDGVPAGYTTYRIYANLTNEHDFVSAVFGDVENPMSIQCTGDILQVAGGGLLGQDINPNFFPFIPATEYDSWLTIDAMFAGDGVGLVATAVPNGIEAFNDFENGEGFLSTTCLVPLGSPPFLVQTPCLTWLLVPTVKLGLLEPT